MGGRPLNSRNHEDIKPQILAQHIHGGAASGQAIDVRSESILEFYQNSGAGNETAGKDPAATEQYAF